MDTIKNRLINLIIDNSSNNKLDNALDIVEKINRELHLIMSHSKQAIFFVASIEDEFDIDIEDEEITLDNFLCFNKLTGLIQNYLLIEE